MGERGGERLGMREGLGAKERVGQVGSAFSPRGSKSASGFRRPWETGERARAPGISTRGGAQAVGVGLVWAERVC